MPQHPVSEPEQRSSLWFLDDRELGELNKLLWSVENECLRFTAAIDVANYKEKCMTSGGNMAFLRRALGENPGDEASKLRLKETFDRVTTIANDKWENCSTGVDCLLNLCAKQAEVKDFLSAARAKVPGETQQFEARQLWERAHSKAPEARAILARLEATMQKFVQMPFQKLYDKRHSKLDVLAPVLKKLTACDYVTDMVGLQSAQDSFMFTIRSIEAEIKDTIYHVPNMSILFDEYARSNSRSRSPS